MIGDRELKVHSAPVLAVQANANAEKVLVHGEVYLTLKTIKKLVCLHYRISFLNYTLRKSFVLNRYSTHATTKINLSLKTFNTAAFSGLNLNTQDLR